MKGEGRPVHGKDSLWEPGTMRKWAHSGSCKEPHLVLSKAVNEQKKDALKGHQDLMPPEGGRCRGSPGSFSRGWDPPRK